MGCQGSNKGSLLARQIPYILYCCLPWQFNILKNIKADRWQLKFYVILMSLNTRILVERYVSVFIFFIFYIFLHLYIGFINIVFSLGQFRLLLSQYHFQWRITESIHSRINYKAWLPIVTNFIQFNIRKSSYRSKSIKTLNETKL